MDTNSYSKGEVERILRRYTVELTKYNYIGPGVDVATGEEGSNQWHMDIIKDTYMTLYGMQEINNTAVVTNKSDINGGFKDQVFASGSAIYYSLKKLLHTKEYSDILTKHNLTPGKEDKKIILVGFGRIGKNAAKLLYKKGYTIIGI